MFVIPEDFTRRMIAIGGTEGREWIARLPGILAVCEQRRGLTIGLPFALSFNYVAPAERSDGTPIVIKACLPNGEMKQVEALQHFDGHGMVRLLEWDPDDEVMLLEQLRPGTPLSAEEDDEKATSIAASVMRQLWKVLPQGHTFPTVSEWGKGFTRLRKHYGGGCGPFSAPLLDEAERLFTELNDSMEELILLHGDLHHENILAAEREPWLAIDPKGVVGEAAYETGALLRNHLHVVLESSNPGRLMKRRVDQLSDELDVDRVRVRGWGLAQAVLSVWWNIEDFGRMENSDIEILACAELLAAIKD